jgi:hypothetical protein
MKTTFIHATFKGRCPKGYELKGGWGRCVPKKRTINRLKVKYSKTSDVWWVESPDGKLLEGFRNFKKAESFAKRTKDFVRR